jgi:MoaA/NifB/PqqE/SkfB family radical SAM enzyme
MDILAFASKRNPVHFATNGTLITADMAQEFVNLNIRSILISLDGTKHFHDDIRGKSNVFERTLQAIEYIVKFKNDKKRSFPNIVINSVVTEHNLESLPELLKIISRFGIKDLGIQMVDLCQYRYAPMDSFSEVFSVPPKLNASQFGNIKEGLIKLYETSYKIGINIQTKPSVTISEFADYYSNRMDLVPYYCIQPWSQAIISPYGDVYPCYILRMGNVRQEKFLKIWNGKRYREFRNLLKKHVLFPQCLGCCFMIRKQSLSRINRILY